MYLFHKTHFISSALVIGACFATQAAHADCSYADAGMFNGWGWNPVTSESCPPQAAQECIDADGDGWGWDGIASCLVSVPVAADCVDSPPLGDGWGWNGVASCEIEFAGVCIDDDGDGVGWNGIEMCQTVVTTQNRLLRIPVNGARVSAGAQDILFRSDDSHYYAADTGEWTDVFVLDGNSGEVSLISQNDNGEPANRRSGFYDISEDGRYVVFSSQASNLDDSQPPTGSQIYLRDRQLGTTTPVSTAPDGTHAWGYNSKARIASGSKSIVFMSAGRNLVERDYNNAADIFIYDIETARLERISNSLDGEAANGRSTLWEITRDGRFVLYSSLASNITDDQIYDYRERLFIYDTRSKTHKLIPASYGFSQSYYAQITQDGNYIAVSRPNNIVQVVNAHTGEIKAGFNNASRGDISPDGRYLAFLSKGSDLYTHDNLYVANLETGELENITSTIDGNELQSDAGYSRFSSDGGYLIFYTAAGNLVEGDANNRSDTFIFDMSQL